MIDNAIIDRFVVIKYPSHFSVKEDEWTSNGGEENCYPLNTDYKHVDFVLKMAYALFYKIIGFLSILTLLLHK